MKKIFKYLMVALIVPVACLFGGCSVKDKPVSIQSITKTDSVGVVDTYTITYTNGKTEQFTIVNGQNGENLYTNITINDLYDEVKDTKPAGYTLIDFIDEYLDIQVDTNAIASAKALRSAVSIYVEHEIEIVDYNNKISSTQSIYGEEITYGFKDSITWGGGSGVIYDLDKTTGDAYIITNYHVCFNAEANALDGIATRFTIYTYGSESLDLNQLNYLYYYNLNCKEYGYLFEQYDENGFPVLDYGYGAIEAEYVGGSATYDIAVLKVSGSELLKNSDCLATDVYNSDLVDVGSTAIAVGNPGGAGISTTKGVISVDSEYISSETTVLREFRIDTPVNSGNSGGGLFDGFGRLIGIVNAKTTDSVTYENMGYAIPSNIATRVADCIIDMCNGVTRQFSKAVIGMSLNTDSSQGKYDETTGTMKIVEVVSIDEITHNSVADKIGLDVGDILTSVEIIKPDETIVVTADRLFKVIDIILLVRDGDCVKFNYTRDGVAGSATTPILTIADHFFIIP